MRSALLFAPRLAGALAGAHGLPALNRILSRARIERRPADHACAWLCEAFGVPSRDGELPLAALTLLGAGYHPGDAYWLHADPVYLQARDDDLVLAGTAELSTLEANALLDALNRHFAPDAIAFVAHAPHGWYARLAAPARVRTTPLECAHGRGIAALLPGGPEALAWHRRANEAQMLLHAHPVNTAREEAGAAPVNSIWFWGGGALPAATPHAGAPACVWADAPLARGLALHASTPLAALPAHGAAWLERAGEGRHLVVLEFARAPAQREAETLARLDETWLAPLLHGLSRGSLRELTLVVPHAGVVSYLSMARADLWKFWRRGHARASV